MRLCIALVGLALACCSPESLKIPDPTPDAGEERSREPSPDATEAVELPASGSCQAARIEPDGGAEHLDDGQTAEYPSYPPSSGPHDPVPLGPGVYPEPLSFDPSGSATPTIFRAVHSLEHGYVLVFHNGLSEPELDGLQTQYRRELKVIVAPEPKLTSKVLLVAWRRTQSCDELELTAVDRFLRRYRESTAPEPTAP